MFSKPLILAIIAACGVTAGAASSPATAEPPPPEQPGDFEPPAVKPKESHWCCQDVDHKTKSGEGCTAMSGSLELINACAEYLYCSGDVAKDNGRTYCL
jgi:hypothetical protein